MKKCVWLMALLMVCVLCASVQAQVSVNNWLDPQRTATEAELLVSRTIVEAEVAAMSWSAFVLEQSAVPGADVDDLCEYYRKKYSDYDVLIAAAYLTLLQCDGEVSRMLDDLRRAEAFLEMQTALLQLMIQVGTYSQEQIDAQRRAEEDAAYQVKVAKQKLQIAEAKRRGTEQYVHRLSQLRSAAKKYLDDNCGGVNPGPVPAPVPDPAF